MTKIIITGFMGSGKTTVAQALARLRRYEMIDLDDLIAAAEGRSAGLIIEEDGESRFREVERQELLHTLGRDENFVLALGGGAWISATNRQMIAEHHATTVWLDAPFDLCWKRIESFGALRPLAPNKQVAFELFAARVSCYELADVRVSVTEHKAAGDLAAEIDQALTNSTRRRMRP
jgi:shikimate kinase